MATGPLRVTERRQEVLVISELYSIYTHWDTHLGRTRHCGGRACYPCSVGAQKQLRVYMLTVSSSGEERYLEVRERHREIFDRYERTTGLRLAVRKLGSASNSPVEVKVLEQVYAIERDISRLVETLALSPLLVGEADPSTGEILREPPEQLSRLNLED